MPTVNAYQSEMASSVLQQLAASYFPHSCPCSFYLLVSRSQVMCIGAYLISRLLWVHTTQCILACDIHLQLSRLFRTPLHPCIELYISINAHLTDVCQLFEGLGPYITLQVILSIHHSDMSRHENGLVTCTSQWISVRFLAPYPA